MLKHPVLIAGAGPVGFTTALLLARRGIPFVLFEGGDKIFDDPRAGTIHPPTLELFEESGVTEAMMAQGFIVNNYHYRDRKAGLIADFDLGVLADQTRYPFRLMLEQHRICYILRDILLKEYPSNPILMRHRVMKVEQDADGVSVTVQSDEGERVWRGSWMVGCDGGRSQVRKSMNVKFDGFTYPERFLVLSTRYDFAQHGYAITNYIADPEEWCALFKVPGHDGKGMWRVVFPAPPDASQEQLFDEASVQARIQGFNPKEGAYEMYHRNLYDVHQRVASSYRDGRLLVAGDAAHINNPLGGMGMNGGIHDAWSLADKLIRIHQGAEAGPLLDLYDRQRRGICVRFVQEHTINNKKLMESKDPDVQKKRQAEFMRAAADPALSRAFLLKTSMIQSLRDAELIQ